MQRSVKDAIKHNPFFLIELDCTNLRAADVQAFHFVRFILFLGAGIGTKYDEAQEDEVGVLLDPLPSEVWLHILSFLRLSELQFAGAASDPAPTGGLLGATGAASGAGMFGAAPTPAAVDPGADAVMP